MWCLHFQAGFRGRRGWTVRRAVERMDIEAGFAGSGASWRGSFAGPGRWLGSSATLRTFFSSVRNGAGCSGTRLAPPPSGAGPDRAGARNPRTPHRAGARGRRNAAFAAPDPHTCWNPACDRCGRAREAHSGTPR